MSQYSTFEAGEGSPVFVAEGKPSPMPPHSPTVDDMAHSEAPQYTGAADEVLRRDEEAGRRGGLQSEATYLDSISFYYSTSLLADALVGGFILVAGIFASMASPIYVVYAIYGGVVCAVGTAGCILHWGLDRPLLSTDSLKLWKVGYGSLALLLTVSMVLLHKLGIYSFPSFSPFCPDGEQWCDDVISLLLIIGTGLILSINAAVGLLLANYAGNSYNSILLLSSSSTDLSRSSVSLRHKDSRVFTSHTDPLLRVANQFNRSAVKGVRMLIELNLLERFMPPSVSDDKGLCLRMGDDDAEVREWGLKQLERCLETSPATEATNGLHGKDMADSQVAVEEESALPHPEDMGHFAACVAEFLRTGENLNLIKIGDFLGDGNPLSAAVLIQYVALFDFTDMELDSALRVLLAHFRLPGEAQKIDRIMERFAYQFCMQNPSIFPSPDTAYVLSFSVIMLNTDAHNPNIKHKMKKHQFLSNNRGIAEGEDLPESYMTALYDRIVSNEIVMDSGGLFVKAAKQGHLRKLSDNDQWQMRFFVLSSNCLYYFHSEKDEKPREIIPLEGLKVSKGSQMRELTNCNNEYPFVFCLHDPDGGLVKSVKFVVGQGCQEGKREKLVLCANSPADMRDWMESLELNIVGNPYFEMIKIKKEVLVQNKDAQSKMANQLKQKQKEITKSKKSRDGTGIVVAEGGRARTAQTLAGSSSSSGADDSKKVAPGMKPSVALEEIIAIESPNVVTKEVLLGGQRKTRELKRSGLDDQKHLLACPSPMPEFDDEQDE